MEIKGKAPYLVVAAIAASVVVFATRDDTPSGLRGGSGAEAPTERAQHPAPTGAPDGNAAAAYPSQTVPLPANPFQSYLDSQAKERRSIDTARPVRQDPANIKNPFQAYLDAHGKTDVSLAEPHRAERGSPAAGNPFKEAVEKRRAGLPIADSLTTNNPFGTVGRR